MKFSKIKQNNRYKRITLNFIIGSFDYWCEDRREDLTEEEARDSNGYKYKHSITFSIFYFKFCVITKSVRPGMTTINGKEFNFKD